MSNESILESAVEWLRRQLNQTNFGELGITLHVHEGQIRRYSTKTEISVKAEK